MTGGAALFGRCLCGAVRYRAEGPALWACHCHCESCRRATSAAFASYFGVARARFAWIAAAPRVYRSSATARRSFCAECGSPMAFEADRWPDEVHLFVASLDDPSRVRPTSHVHVAEALDWMRIVDDLPRHPGPLDAA